MAVFPSDHFVLEEAAFMTHVTAVARWVETHPDRIVLLGAPPSGPDVEYGWIERGEGLGETESRAIFAIKHFWEKPSPAAASAYLAAGCLWNTLVVVAKVRALLRAGREQLPEVSGRLARIAPFVGTEEEAWAVQQAYAFIPRANFSRAILEPCPPALTVSELPPLTWSDLGTPRRVFELLNRVEIRPSWLVASDLSA